MINKLFVSSFTIILFSMAGCLGGGGVTGEYPAGYPDIKVSGPLSIDESEIAAEISESSLKISFAVSNSKAAHFPVLASAKIASLDGSYEESREKTVVFSSKTETVDFDFTPLKDSSNAAQAGYVIKYEFRWGGLNYISGTRSLFMASPKTNIVLLAPENAYEGEKTHVKVFAQNPVTGKALPGTEITLLVAHPDGKEEVFSGKTDKFGAAAFETSFPLSGSAKLSATTKTGKLVEKVEGSVNVVRELRVLLTTDKPIYQPGQEMHLRSLALRKPDLLPEADKEAIFEVFDGKGNKVFREKKTTNDYGISYARFRLATEVNMGKYKISVTVGNTVSEKSVTVEKYVLPKFKVDVALDKAFYIVGDNLEGVVNAAYFFGKPVTGAAVAITGYQFDIGFTQFAKVEGAANDEGIFSFEMKLPDYLVGQALEQGKGLIKLDVEVKDTAGQYVKKEIGVTVAQSAINVVVIPESGDIAPGIENFFYIFAEDPAGAPLALDLTASIDGQNFDLKSDENGFASLVFAPEGEAVEIKINASDGKGGKAEKTFSFKAGHSGGSVLLRTDKVIYDVGDTMKISVFAPDQKDRIYLDVIKKYQTIMMKSLDLSGGKAELEIDIDESMAGDILLDSYYLTYSGQIIRDKKIVFVKNAGSLNLEVKSEKEVYLPGEEAKINFKVTDGEGNGKPSAIGIQIVDEAVFALSENKPGLLKLYFELEDEIASPKYEIHGAHFDLSSIVTTNPENEKEAETLDTKAKAAFAALMETGFSGEYSSWKEAQKEIAQLLNPHYQKHKEQVIQYLRELYQKGELNDKTIKDFLANQKVFYDYWGNLYVFEVPDNYTMKMSSAGLDEVMGTGDDWSANVSIYEIYGWWEEDFMGNGIPGAAQDAAMNEPFDDPNKKTGGGEEPKIRKYFPETLYVNPALITDEKGEAVLSVMMADSITEWRVSSLASDAFGKLGSNVTGVKVFMDFFVDLDLPRTMTRGDEVSFPVVVYNYLKGDQTVKLELMSDDWFELKGAAEQTLTLKEGEVKSTNFPIKVKDVGWHGLTVKAYGDGASDAVMRLVEIVPDGTEIRESVSGKLAGVVHQKLNFPAEIIPNTENLIVKIYPGVLSQAVEGLDSILKMPSGCFEQTTSTCWPNVLVLDYMMTSGQVTPEIELKAREFVNVGYQRLLTYECTGGGFTWFGDPNPANVILSAIGVMEFSDMAKVHEIDENVIKRTQDFLAKKQAADGSWSENQGSEFATVQYDTLITTCFVTWSLASSEYQGGSADSGIGYITANLDDAASTYSYAMCANAFASHNPNSSKTMEVLNELLDRRIEEGDLVHWENEGGNTNYYYGEGGSSTNIEVTALAVLALLEAGAAPDIVSGAINYLVTKKDSFGNWNTTHATILTLKAFVKSLSAMVQDADGVVAIEVNGTQVTPLVVNEDNKDVFQQFELKPMLNKQGENEVAVDFKGEGSLMYQIVWWSFVPYETAPVEPQGQLKIEVSYDKTKLTVDDSVTATVNVFNLLPDPAPMVLVDLGIPPGFDVVTDSLEEMVKTGEIMKFEMTGKQIIVYIDEIEPLGKLTLTYILKAKYPLKATAPSSSASLYYDPESKTDSGTQEIEVY